MATDPKPLCIFCAVEMILKTVFGKDVWECPKCKRRVPVGQVTIEDVFPSS